MRGMLTIPWLALCLLSFASGRTLQDGAPTAQELVDQGWRLLPVYDGVPRSFLRAQERRRVGAGVHVFEAALALEPEHLRALWSAGHAHTLLAEDRRNRGEAEAARWHDDQALRFLTRSLELDASDPWSAYARGVVHANLGDPAGALDDLDLAVENAERRIAAAGDEGSDAWLRFKALEWRPEILMRAGRFGEARETLRTFHDEFSSNEWPLYIALAECNGRARELAAMRANYHEILSRAEFRSDPQAYALAGYVEGLLGDRVAATRLLQKSLEHELEPGLYSRLWLWILATDEARPEAEADLRAFLENPPASVGEWDAALGRFVLGEGTPEAFLARARTEEQRRKAEGEALDELLCEASYYAGQRLEAAGEPEAALATYGAALEPLPRAWKWEAAFARARYAALAERLGRAARAFPTDGVTGWHVPGAEHPQKELARSPRAGDLAFVRGVNARGQATFEARVVLAE